MARIVPSVRNKPRIMQDICADCGSTDPSWASVNKGILICDGCCSVHRSLGRHISIVKALSKGVWHPSELAMVHSLNNFGANSIWEHTLLDPSAAKVLRKKPHPNDPVHPTKADFIRAKHQMLSFVHRPNKDENVDMDFSKQLHASVRTSNLEISLRLLSLGSDPNYLNMEKGNCPLHVAAAAGQSSQVELLMVHGADPGSQDFEGKTPVDYAREAGYQEIAERLEDFQHELTDRLSYFMCGRKPDHHKGEHWLIPEMDSERPTDLCNFPKDARSKLVALPNHSFEELICDVYEEVDRREMDAMWLSLQSQTESSLLVDRCAVPFLPLNPELSSTRNQGRQKLARFNSREFAILVIDLLVEARRRTCGSSLLASPDKEQPDSGVAPVQSHHTLTNAAASPTNNYFSDRNNAFRQTCPAVSRHASPPVPTFINTSLSRSLVNCHSTSAKPAPASVLPPFGRLNDDEEPLYDSVASEDDYSSWERRKKLQTQQKILDEQKTQNAKFRDSDYQDVVDSSDKLRTELNSKEQTNSALPISISEYMEMKRYLEMSESRIQELQQSNVVMTSKLNELASMVHTLKEENDSLRHDSTRNLPRYSPEGGSSYFPGSSYPGRRDRSDSSHCRSLSPSYESSIHRGQPNGDVHLRKLRMRDHDRGPMDVWFSRHQRPYSMFESTKSNNYKYNLDRYNHTYGSKRDDAELEQSEYFHAPSCLPTQEEVVRKTEVITKRIQELLSSAQESEHDKFIPCSEQIVVAVKEMANLFPKTGVPQFIAEAVHQLTISSCRLQSECRNHITSQLHILDPSTVTQQVIQCAYDIAKAAKNLVTHFQ